MRVKSEVKPKLIMVLEIFLAGIYLALTKGLFIVYLVSIGLNMSEISTIILASAAAITSVSYLIHKVSSFLTSKVKLKLLLLHGLERVLWFLIPLTTNYLVIAAIYMLITCLPVGALINLVIYGLFEEEEIREVTAKRSVAFRISSIIGFFIAIILLTFMPDEAKYLYTFSLGSMIGLISTLSISFLDLSKLEGLEIPKGIEQPEKVFTTSLSLLSILVSGNLLGIAWIPYVMIKLGGTDSIAVSISLTGTFASIFASMFWSKKRFKSLRYSLALDALTPVLILASPLAPLQVTLAAYSSFTYTGANFLGSFLFARYNKWLGPIKSTLIIVTLNGLAQFIAASIGVLIREDFLTIFSIIVVSKLVSTILVFLTVPETALIPEDLARIYSRTLYRNSVLGYKVAVELSIETLATTLKLLALTLVILTLYIIYRALTLILT